MLPGTPSRAGIRDDLVSLADSLMEGRGHASRGAVEAQSYLLRRFRQRRFFIQFRPDHRQVRNSLVILILLLVFTAAACFKALPCIGDFRP